VPFASCRARPRRTRCRVRWAASSRFALFSKERLHGEICMLRYEVVVYWDLWT
jgi:hypothetical protein